MIKRKNKLSTNKQNRLIEYFVAATTARVTAYLVGINRNTAAYYFYRLRKIMSRHIEADNKKFLSGDIQLDESYFGVKRKGKRGLGAAAKIPIFGLLKQGDKDYTKIIPDANSRTLMPIIQSPVQANSIDYSDNWHAYNVLDTSEFNPSELTI